MDSKRKKKKIRNFRIFVIGIIVVWIYNTFTIKMTYVTIHDKKIKNNIVIVQITDLHDSIFGANNSILIAKIKKSKPDIVVATGDMYTFHNSDKNNAEGQKNALELMGNLAKDFKVYYVNGEHDNSPSFKEQLKDRGVHVLDYICENLKIGKTNINLFGINNVYYSPTFNLSNEFQLNYNEYNILLAHISNAQAFTSIGMDLSICGDTHGGQVNIPFLGPVYNDERWFPNLLSKKELQLTKGLYEVNGKKIFISSGLGNYPVAIRFMNRPEIAVIKLESDSTK